MKINTKINVKTIIIINDSIMYLICVTCFSVRVSIYYNNNSNSVYW